MPEFKLEKHVYPVEDGATADDIGQKVTAILSLPFAVETITVTRGEISAMIWEPDTEPPYGDIPDPPAGTIRELLHKIELDDLTEDNCEFNLTALESVAKMMIQSRRMSKEPVAWVTGHTPSMCEWMNITPTPARLLGVPVYETTELPRDKFVLLCGKSSRIDPLDTDYGVLVSIPEAEDAEV